MSSNIAVSISAEVSGLTAGLAQAKASLLDTNKALRDLAKEMNEAGSTASTELRTKFAQAGEAAADAQGKVSRLSSELRRARGPMDELSHASEHQAGIVREKLVLAHETLMGNYTRFGGSMMVLAERTGSFGSAIRAMITPTTVAVGAVIAIGAAFAEALISTERWNESFGAIKTAMDATGQGLEYNRGAIASYVNQIRELPGVSTKAAAEIIASFARQRDIGVGSYGQLGIAAAGFARATGEEVPHAAAKLVTALDSGYDALAKLDRQFPFLSVAQAKAIHDFDASGERAKAYAVAIEALQAKFGPLVRDGLTPLQTSVNEVKVAWDEFTRAIGDSSWANAIITNIAHILDWMTSWVRSSDDVRNHMQAIADQKPPAQVALPAKPQPATPAPVVASPAPAPAPAQTAEVQTATHAAQEELRTLRDIQDENFRLKSDEAERDRIKKELARDEEALKGATGSEAAMIRDNIALLQRQQRELNNRQGATQLQDLRDELQKELAERRLVGDKQKQYELRYWRDHLDQVRAGSQAEVQIRTQINTLQHELDTKALADSWANYSEHMRLKIEASKSHIDQQIALANEWVARGKALYGNDVRNYKAALDEQARLLRQKVEDDIKIRQIALQSQATIARIDLGAVPTAKGQDAHSLVNWLFGDIDGTGANAELDRRLNVLALELKAKQAEFQAVINDAQSTGPQIAKAQADLMAAQEQYAVDIANLNRQAAEQVRQAWESTLAPIENAINSSLQGMMEGTQSVRDGMRRLAQSVVLSFIQAGVKQAFSALAKQMASLTAPMFGQGGSLSGVGSLLGLGGGAAGAGGQAAQAAALTANTTALTTLTTALTGHGVSLTANTTATTAGTAATTTNTASQTTNLIGNSVQTDVNTTAVAANTSALGASAASGGGGFLSFLGGLAMFDVGTDSVPRDMVAMVHQGEIIVPASEAANIRSGQSLLGYPGGMRMALPAGAADTMRMMVSGEPPPGNGGGGGGQRGGDVNFHYAPSINAGSNIDLESVLMQQGSAMRRWLSNQMRNGAFRT